MEMSTNRQACVYLVRTRSDVFRRVTPTSKENHFGARKILTWIICHAAVRITQFLPIFWGAGRFAQSRAQVRHEAHATLPP